MIKELKNTTDILSARENAVHHLNFASMINQLSIYNHFQQSNFHWIHLLCISLYILRLKVPFLSNSRREKHFFFWGQNYKKQMLNRCKICFHILCMSHLNHFYFLFFYFPHTYFPFRPKLIPEMLGSWARCINNFVLVDVILQKSAWER